VTAAPITAGGVEASAERPDCARLLVTLPRAAGNHLGDLGRSGCRGANVLPAHQYTTDPERGRVFLRIEFHQRGLDAARERFEADFARVVATALEMGWRISYTRGRKRVAILVSRYQHCLPDLLWRWRGAELEADIGLVGSNHHDAAAQVEPFGVPYDVARVTHDDTVDALTQIGRDIERTVLARAVRWHLEDRVLVHENRTVVFR
jgi:formyltetrahydrofolate deformylase